MVGEERVHGGAAGRPDECVCFCRHLFPTHQMLIHILSCCFGTSLFKIIRDCIYNRWLLHDLPRYLRITNVPNSKIICWQNLLYCSLLIIYCEFTGVSASRISGFSFSRDVEVSLCVLSYF